MHEGIHNNNPADDHTAAAPYGGAARPAPDKGAGTTTLTPTQRSSTPPSALRGRAPALAGRVTATQCGSGPLGTGAAGGVPPPPPSTKPKPPAHAGSRPSAAESGRAADRELSGVWTEFEALATRHSRPRPSGESVHSERLRGRFTNRECPSCGGTHSPGVGLSGTLLSTYSRVGHSSQPHHIQSHGTCVLVKTETFCVAQGCNTEHVDAIDR